MAAKGVSDKGLEILDKLYSPGTYQTFPVDDPICDELCTAGLIREKLDGDWASRETRYEISPFGRQVVLNMALAEQACGRVLQRFFQENRHSL